MQSPAHLQSYIHHTYRHDIRTAQYHTDQYINHQNSFYMYFKEHSLVGSFGVGFACRGFVIVILSGCWPPVCTVATMLFMLHLLAIVMPMQKQP